jgi:hypothetical protein
MKPSALLPHLDLCPDVNLFFRRVVDEVRRRRSLDTTEAATSYVVSLLVDFADPNRYDEVGLEQPLTVLVRDALSHQGPNSFEKLRQLGDVVLYLSGFFGEFFERHGVTQDYVSTLGAQAYQGARRALVGRYIGFDGDVAGGDVFGELSANFEVFVVLVQGVALDLPGSKRGGNADLLDLYERWLKTRSATLEAELATKGFIFQPGDGTVH